MKCTLLSNLVIYASQLLFHSYFQLFTFIFNNLSASTFLHSYSGILVNLHQSQIPALGHSRIITFTVGNGQQFLFVIPFYFKIRTSSLLIIIIIAFIFIHRKRRIRSRINPYFPSCIFLFRCILSSTSIAIRLPVYECQ